MEKPEDREWVLSPVRTAEEGDVLGYFAPGPPNTIRGEVVSVHPEARLIIIRDAETDEVFEMAFSHRGKSLHIKRLRRVGEAFDWEVEQARMHAEYRLLHCR